MRRGKSFVRFTRKGKVLKIVKEHYLRDDLYCGDPSCEECRQVPAEAKLAAEPLHNKFLIVDTNVVLHQTDLMMNDCGLFDNIIFLQTVLDETRHRNRKLYSKVRKHIASSSNCFVFCNEHHRSTYVERLPGESANDRNDRAIRVASRWYTQHVQGRDVLLLTNDKDNKTKAVNSDLACVTMEEFVKGHKQEYPQLLDQLAQQEENEEDDKTYPRHWTPAEIAKGVEEGKVKKGTFQVKRNYFAEAMVNVRDLDFPIFIPGKNKHNNRAVDGDVVAVLVLPEAQWQKPSRRLRPPPKEVEDNDDLDDTTTDDGRVPTGKIVGIFQRNWRAYCGSFELTDQTQGRVLFLAVNRKIPKIRVESRQIQQLMDKRIMVAIDSWPADSHYPIGHFVKSLGNIGDRKVETEVLLIEHEIPTAPWSDEILACLPPEDYIIPPEEYEKRTDLRDYLICSIDPPGCTDIDDALHCKELPNGNFEVGVHIADVTHFMQADTALDISAAHRGTSVYLVDRRIDMIPGLLSTDLCSLHEKVERLAFSCVWELDQKANIVDTRFFRSIIKSVGAFTYGQAQERIDKGLTDPVSKSIFNLNELAKCLKAKRFAAGALNLASTQAKFTLDKETQQPTDVAMYQMKEVNSLVEEFMLLANVSVAKKTLEQFPNYAMLRRHPVPKPDAFLPLIRAAKCAGMEIKAGSSKALADSLDNCQVPGKPFFNQLMRILTTRCMTQAVYFSSGDVTPKEFLHYGLASPVYTHFTSPIRRYADCIVHRLLAHAIGIGPLPTSIQDKSKVKAVAENINHRNRMAQLVSRASGELFTLEYFKGKEVLETAMITEIRNNGFRVLVPKFGLEGAVTLYRESREGEPKTTNPWKMNEEDLTLTNGNETYRIFANVPVVIYVKESEARRRWLMIDLAPDTSKSNPSPSPSSPSSSNTDKAQTPQPKNKGTRKKPLKKRRKTR